MNLKEFSSMLGLSQTTVSRALNGHRDVKEATRERVVAAAKLHNYSPNARAKALATGCASTIAHVLPTGAAQELPSPIFAEFVAGAGEIYARHGFDMLVSVCAFEDEARTYEKIAASGSADGFMLHGMRRDDPRIPKLVELGLPFVAHGCARAADSHYAFVDVDNRDAFRRAAELLIDLGHRRIAFLNGMEGMAFADHRQAGFEQALAARGVPLLERWALRAPMTERYGFEATSRLLSEPSPPSAILTASMITALGVRRAAMDRGLLVGRDLSIVTHDDHLSHIENEGEYAMFTATRSSVRDAGRRCAEMLIERVRAPETPLRQRMLTAQLVIGASTGRAP